LKEIGIISDIIKENAAPNAKIKFGIVDDEKMEEVLRVTVIATGFKKGIQQRSEGMKPTFLSKSKSQKSTQMSPEEPGRKRDSDQEYLFKTAEKTINLTDLEYINETNLPNLAQNPENYDDILEVPSFQRPKVTEKND
jgi:hypothetical protein